MSSIFETDTTYNIIIKKMNVITFNNQCIFLVKSSPSTMSGKLNACEFFLLVKFK